MTGFGETVGGWFASSVIDKAVDWVFSNLGNNNALQSETAEMVTSLKNSRSQIEDAIVEARKMPTKNRAVIKWIDNLMNAADEVRDVLDDFEAKRIRERLEGKNKVIESGNILKTLILPDKDLMRLKSSIEKFSKIPGEFKDFRDQLPNEYSTTNRRETSSYLDRNSKIFGRDLEIYFILDMILNYQLMCFPKENSEPESHPSSFRGSGQESRGKRKWSSGTSSEIGKEGIKLEKPVLVRNWKLPVLPICGLGGMGKTTIAQIVYNNDIVKEVFDERFWVYVSEKFWVLEEVSWFSLLTSLETLEFSGCMELRGLPSTILLLTKLKKLTIDFCPMISSLPESGIPPYLTELYITNCSDELVRRCQPEPDQGEDWRKISHIPHIQIKPFIPNKLG